MGLPSGSRDEALAALVETASALEAELATWRRRCLLAETEVEEAARRVPPVTIADVTILRQRLVEVEGENQRLRDRIATAREQIEQLRTRLHFVEEHVGGDSS